MVRRKLKNRTYRAIALLLIKISDPNCIVIKNLSLKEGSPDVLVGG
jgi:hypothetical protein